MKHLLLVLLLSGCASLTPAQQKKLENDTYKTCKVVVQVHEALADAGSPNE